MGSGSYRDAVQTPMRILLVDDHEMVLHGLTVMLARFPETVQVIGTVSELSDAVRAYTEDRPDIVLCDVRLRQVSGLDVCKAIRDVDGHAKVVFLTVYDDEQ